MLGTKAKSVVLLTLFSICVVASSFVISSQNGRVVDDAVARSSGSIHTGSLKLEAKAEKVFSETGDEVVTDSKVVVRHDTIPQISDLSATASDLSTDEKTTKSRPLVREQPPIIVPATGFNVVLTHCTADFDSLASAVGLAKLWSCAHDGEEVQENLNGTMQKTFDSTSHVPTFVVLPRGAHPSVQRFLALHKHLFPIRSLKSLPADLSGLNRLGLVDAQRRDRIGPAENLLSFANRVTVVDHHIDSESDINETTDYVLDKVGSVSTMIVERLKQASLELSDAEATLLALGIHADTGSLVYDSTTPRDCAALAWVMNQGASQTAIAEHAQSSLSQEQQGVLTQALINTNSTVVHGVTISTVLLTASGFINGLAAVTQDALELSSSDIFLLALVYEAQSGGKRKSKSKKANNKITATLFNAKSDMALLSHDDLVAQTESYTEAWRGGDEALRRKRLRFAFDRRDINKSGFLERKEIEAALASSGLVASSDAIHSLLQAMDTDGDGKVDFEEFYQFSMEAEKRIESGLADSGKKPSTMIVIGRVKAGENLKAVKLNSLFEQFGGGGHAKAASTTIRLDDPADAEGLLQGLVDELIETSLHQQPTAGDFMTAPVLSVKPDMNEKQVEDLFTRYDVRALPVVDDANDVIGLVTYKEVAAAKQRLWNKEQKRLRMAKMKNSDAPEKKSDSNGKANDKRDASGRENQKSGSTVKGWMKQHVRVVEASTTMAELEIILLANDVGCIPVVADGTQQLIGMVTRTDLLRQHRYYPSLHYHNKGFADSIASRKPIIELRKRLKKFDLDE